MAIVAVLMDTAAPPGSKLDPALRAEIEKLAPGLEVGEVDTAELADDSVTREKIHAGAVGTVEIATDGVEAANIKAGAVGTPELADDSVTAAKAGLGVSTAYDVAGNPVEDKKVYLTSAQFSALAVKDPNTTYYIS
ncbi:MAG: hypothetical protein JO214_00650 [Frankiaceae bacterium]|nr:hypothetical protein [Frankiaceae bacterium]